MKTTIDPELKRKITARWNVMSVGGPEAEKARAQVEYILQEAGLLARPRPRRAKIENLEAAINGKKAA